MAMVCMALGVVIVWGVLLIVERLLEARKISEAARAGVHGFEVDVKAIQQYLAEIEELRKHGVEA
jgi:hypothetical protein